jgi:hypothetical protein
MSLSFRADPAAFLRSARDRALERPWLLAPPLAGAAARRAIAAALAGDAAAASGILIGAVVTVAACAAFAELWLREDGRAVPGRARAALALYLLPMLVMAAVGASSLALWLAFGSDSSGSAKLILIGTAIAGKLASGAATVLVSLALAGWSRERGLPGALRDGAGLFAANAGACLLLVLAAWAAQEATGLVLAAALGGAADAPFFFQAFGLIGEALIAAFALAGCVALPLQAALESR